MAKFHKGATIIYTETNKSYKIASVTHIGYKITPLDKNEEGNHEYYPHYFIEDNFELSLKHLLKKL